jgi:hypothetical protein
LFAGQQPLRVLAATPSASCLHAKLLSATESPARRRASAAEAAVIAQLQNRARGVTASALPSITHQLPGGRFGLFPAQQLWSRSVYIAVTRAHRRLWPSAKRTSGRWTMAGLACNPRNSVRAPVMRRPDHELIAARCCKKTAIFHRVVATESSRKQPGFRLSRWAVRAHGIEHSGRFHQQK